MIPFCPDSADDPRPVWICGASNVSRTISANRCRRTSLFIDVARKQTTTTPMDPVGVRRPRADRRNGPGRVRGRQYCPDATDRGANILTDATSHRNFNRTAACRFPFRRC